MASAPLSDWLTRDCLPVCVSAGVCACVCAWRTNWKATTSHFLETTAMAHLLMGPPQPLSCSHSHTHTHKHTYTHIHTNIHIETHTHKHIHMRIRTCALIAYNTVQYRRYPLYDTVYYSTEYIFCTLIDGIVKSSIQSILCTIIDSIV